MQPMHSILIQKRHDKVLQRLQTLWNNAVGTVVFHQADAAAKAAPALAPAGFGVHFRLQAWLDTTRLQVIGVTDCY